VVNIPLPRDQLADFAVFIRMVIILEGIMPGKDPEAGSEDTKKED
jgi:hypothetical protein